MSLITIYTAVGTIRPDATTRGKTSPASMGHLTTHQSDPDRVGTAERRAGLQNNALMDVRHVDRQERAAKEGHLACAACLCTLTVSRTPRCHLLPCTCGEKLEDKLNRPAKAVTGATRR